MAVTTAERVPVTQLRQQEPVDDRQAAVRAMLGSCILGALDHFGARDLADAGCSSREDVLLVDLRRLFTRKDKGLHGCGFEYTLHEGINDASSIPASLRACVTTAIGTQVGALFEQLQVPVTTWGLDGLRSVMFGTERRGREGLLEGTARELGQGALLWPSPGAAPVRVAPLLPIAVPPRRLRGARDDEWPTLPATVANLWQVDLFVGGPAVMLDRDVRRVLAADGLAASVVPTAWLGVTVKYRHGALRAGAGLHLGVETAWNGRTHTSGTEAVIGERDGLRTITLPLDAVFVGAFNRAWYVLKTSMLHGLRRSSHPTDTPSRWSHGLASELGERRAQPAVEVAEWFLRGGQPDLIERVTTADGTTLTGNPAVAPVPALQVA